MGIIIAGYNYTQIFDVCGRINLVVDGTAAFDRLTPETSVPELTDLVVQEYRNASKGIR